jgi:phosphatidylglycerol:prolipoprotein diacylglycerol transferase
MLSYITWDPSRGMFNFNLPLLGRPILWYGFFFALGFFVGYFLLTYLLRRYFHEKKHAAKVAEQISLYVVIGALIGSRLGDVLFYQNWADIIRNPISLIAIWEGGLASHGGAAGILIALWLFAKKTKIPFWTSVDFVVIPTAAAAIFIRIGNFFNQEILGVPTSLPWGVLFLHPADAGPIVPRHPAQLYEAIAYACVLAILLFYWHRHPPFAKRGRLTGLFLTLVFSLRFLIEFIKMEQSAHLSCSGCLTMGQYLSIPFILLGVWLLMRKRLN